MYTDSEIEENQTKEPYYLRERRHSYSLVEKTVLNERDCNACFVQKLLRVISFYLFSCLFASILLFVNWFPLYEYMYDI